MASCYKKQQVVRERAGKSNKYYWESIKTESDKKDAEIQFQCL